jgi:hypothetical protein
MSTSLQDIVIVYALSSRVSDQPRSQNLRVIGYTGSGKTTVNSNLSNRFAQFTSLQFIQNLTGRPDLETHPSEPCTNSIQAYEMDLDGIKLSIVDTPGLRAESTYDRALRLKLDELYVHSIG